MEFFLLNNKKKLPLILQSEASECGLACLAMVGAYHGHRIDLHHMRRAFAVSLSGMTLAALEAAAEQLGMTCRFIRADLHELRQLHLPAIAFWDLNHFVVISSVRKDVVTIHDPARGCLKLSMSEVSKSFTGLAVELSPKVSFVPITAETPFSLFHILGKVNGWRPAAAQVIVIAISLEVIMLLLPMQAQWVLDSAVAGSDRSLLFTLSAAFMILVVVQGALNAGRGWALSLLGATVAYQWVTNLFGHLTRLPMEYFGRRHIGDVTSRFSSVQQVERTLSGNFVESMLDGVSSCFAVVVLLNYSYVLGLVAIGCVGIYALSRLVFYQQLWRTNEEGLIFRAKQQSELLESVRGIQSIKLANRQAERRQRFANMTMEACRRDVAVQRLVFFFTSLSQTLFGLQRSVVLCLAGMLTLDGKMTLGMLVASLAFAEQFTQRAGVFVDRCIELRVLNLHLERIADISTQAPESGDVLSTSVKPVDSSWELENINFRYSDSAPWLFRELSISIPSGKSVAIVGPSGAGKTTLAKIILGLLGPNSGRVIFGSVDINQLGMTSYRNLVSTVMQDDCLFAGTIAENISFFDGRAKQELVEQAAMQAAIHEEIMAFPMGYDTLVGDMGSTLSGGQKQRVILARALYRKPSALILDEATSHLDSGAEAEVNAAVSKLCITRIIIAHRKDTIEMADYVYDLSRGEWQDGRSPHASRLVS